MPKVQPIPANDAVAATNTYRIDIPENSISVTERELTRMTKAAQQTTRQADLTDEEVVLLKVS